jgi:hypothetical protein
MLPIYKETPATTRIVEVEERKEISQVIIQSLNQVERESLEEHLLRPTRLTSKFQHFVKISAKELHQEVFAKVCSGELIMEKLQSGKIEDIMKYYSLWEEYQDQKQGHRNS